MRCFILLAVICALVLQSAGCQEAVSVEAIPSTTYALRGGTSTIDVLFQIKTKAIEADHNAAPVEIAIVLDVSGSMGERNKIDQSKFAIKNLISKLKPTDKVHLITYSTGAQIIFVNGDLQNSAYLQQQVDEIRVDGWTNMMSGIELAHKILRESKEQDATRLQRIFLFSDGQVNQGVTDKIQISERISEMNQDGIIFTSFGIGADFDEVLMKLVAEKGLGDYFYISNAEEVPSMVDRALRGLLSVVGSNAVLKIRGLNGAIVTKIFHHESVTAGAHLGDLTANNLQKVLCEVEYSAPTQTQDDGENIVLWTLTYTPPNQQTPIKLSGNVRILFTDEKEKTEIVSTSVEATKTVMEMSMNDILEMMEAGHVTEAIERQNQDIEKLEKMTDDDEGTLEMYKKKLRKTLLRMQSPDKSVDELKKEIHYNQYSMEKASLFLSDTEWKENK